MTSSRSPTRVCYDMPPYGYYSYLNVNTYTNAFRIILFPQLPCSLRLIWDLQTIPRQSLIELLDKNVRLWCIGRCVFLALFAPSLANVARHSNSNLRTLNLCHTRKLFSTRDELFNKDSSFTPSITSPRARTHAASDSWQKLSSGKENTPWNRRPLAQPRPLFDKNNDEADTDGLPEFKLESEQSLSLLSRLKRENSGSGGSGLGFGNRAGLRSLQTARALNEAEEDDVSPSLEPVHLIALNFNLAIF